MWNKIKKKRIDGDLAASATDLKVGKMIWSKGRVWWQIFLIKKSFALQLFGVQLSEATSGPPQKLYNCQRYDKPYTKSERRGYVVPCSRILNRKMWWDLVLRRWVCEGIILPGKRSVISLSTNVTVRTCDFWWFTVMCASQKNLFFSLGLNDNWTRQEVFHEERAVYFEKRKNVSTP